MTAIPGLPDTEFTRKLNGTLYGIMTWGQLSALWSKLDAAAGWYLYAVGHAVPATPAGASQVQTFVTELDALLRKEHREDYCSIVYVDDLEHPSFIKIYDPNHLGSSCGSSKAPTPPGWVMSQTPPVEIKPTWVVPQSRQRWWNQLLTALR